jgi:2-hydroxychromene-2-carboxylate isomerase
LASAEFWYEFASTYSYPAALRVGALADARGVRIVWRPFLLGPIFAAQGWRDSPFNLYPAKGHYMWRDLERTCAAMGLPLKRPEPFPQPSLLAARVALALDGDQRSDFSRRVFAAEFGQGLPIGERATLSALLEECGVDPAAALERAESAANKARLKAECALATEIGIIGAPCLVTADGEVFWGNDRLEQGLDWATNAGGAA